MTDIALKSVVAAAFFCFLHGYILKSSPETTLLWTVAAGLGAAYLAWSQQQRRM
jgi:hypothetical protein